MSKTLLETLADGGDPVTDEEETSSPESVVEEESEGADELEGSSESTEESSEGTDGFPGLTLEHLESLTGMKLRKYGDVESALRGLAEGARAVGQRNQDAEMWQLLKQQPQEVQQAIGRILSGEKSSEPVSSPVSSDALPRSYDEFEILQKRVLDSEGNVRPNADPGAVAALQRSQRQMQETLLRLASNPAEFLASQAQTLQQKLRDEILRETTQTAAQQAATQREEAEVQQISQQYASQLYENGDLESMKLTPFGSKVKSEFDELTSDGMSRVKALRKAIKYAMAGSPQPNKTKPVNSRSTRKPAVAVPPKGGMDQREFFQKNSREGLVKLFEAIGGDKE